MQRNRSIITKPRTLWLGVIAVGVIAVGALAVIMLAAAGAGGDCDGKCVENATSLPVFFMIIGGALTSMILGAIMMFQAGGLSE